MATEPKWDDDLAGTAYDIAESDAQRLRVLAGPGTVKTYAMKRRVMRLLQDGGHPKRILVCTFTRTAARDVAKEIGDLGIAGVKEVNAGTLHAFCFSVLRRRSPGTDGPSAPPCHRIRTAIPAAGSSD